MFYKRLCEICEKKGIKLTPLVKECGGSTGSIGNWKNGASPNSDIVIKLSTHLNVSTDYLLTGKELNNISLTENEKELLEYFSRMTNREQIKLIGWLEYNGKFSTSNAEQNSSSECETA